MPRLPTSVLFAAAALAAASIPSAGCGGGGGGAAGGGASSPNATAAPPSSAPLAAAAHPTLDAFPPPRGRTLQQLANTFTPGLTGGAASTLYTPGRNRLAFGLLDDQSAFVYGATAVYVARGPAQPARGPFLAPADSLEVRPAFRSRTSSGDSGDVKAIYHADVDLPAPGGWYALTATKVGSKTYGTALMLSVKRSSPIPAVGDAAPRIDTPTVASAGGDVSKIETRDPPDDMHDVNLKDVLGKRPVALLFATPALCQSRVCGPVVDIAAQLQAAYGDRVAFIHNEVYVDNDANKGLRPQLKAFGLTTEPWLFTIDRRGRVVARLEGAFGFEEFRDAIEAALRQ